MEKFASLAAETNLVNDYWCAMQTRKELYCLDIAAPSTMSGSFNTTLSTHDNVRLASTGGTTSGATLNHFGQIDACGDKLVGDGMINVFDIAALITYIFNDPVYSELSRVPTSVQTVQGRDFLAEQCHTPTSRATYLAAYAEDTCVHFETSRRLLEEPSSARELLDRWVAAPQVPYVPSRFKHLVWPWLTPKSFMPPAPAYTMRKTAHHIYSGTLYDTGRWHTVHVSSIPIGLHIVFTGMQDQVKTLLSNKVFEDEEPRDSEERQVRYTRKCEHERCDTTCATIETTFSSRMAMVHSTLELVQRPSTSACLFAVHVWVPTNQQIGSCIGIEYMVVSDGERGAFATNGVCSKAQVESIGDDDSPAPAPAPAPALPAPSFQNATIEPIPAPSPPLSPPDAPPAASERVAVVIVVVMGVLLVALAAACAAVSFKLYMQT